MSYLASKIPNICMCLTWDIMNNFLNFADIKFPVEIESIIQEQIQYLNL
jgi:hypothetical protein